MRRLLGPILLLCAVGALCGGPLAGLAAGAGLSPPVEDCNAHGQLTRHYTPQQLRTGLATMPADIKEYTNCYNVLTNALLQEVGKLHGSAASSGGGSFLPAWLIVVLALLVAGGAAFGILAMRNRP